MDGWINVYLGYDGVQFLGCVAWPSRERAARMSQENNCPTIYRIRVRLR